MSENWYVLNVKPHKERSVCKYLEETTQLAVYFPAIRVKPKNPRAARVRPYFPGYLFVRLDLQAQGVNALSWTPGAKGLVCFGGEPAVVPENMIHDLKRRISEIDALGELPSPGLKPGDRVRIVSGPFEGYEGIFDAQLPGKERVQVLLSFLSNQLHRIKLDLSNVEKVT